MAIDGNKLKANASKHKAMSYRRIEEEQQRLRAEVRRLQERAEAADAQEDAAYGRDRRGDDLPAELARREGRLRRIEQAKRALEERARAAAATAGKDEQAQKEAKPEPKAQYNFTDPESRITKARTLSCRVTTRRSRSSLNCNESSARR